ncbi:hypothetical protein [Bradyrhizobium sp. USDA 3458]|uniref:hypothetical protein n=1 Tax=Bradyrhizobium sp. USDA 3458 TaxID=2591461 RepID=UPI001141488E|nr:hypothetical protein [Bradyrhizobium sp. USDA 3458]
MLKSKACHAAARRLGISKSRAEGLVARLSEAGLLPLTAGKARQHLSHRQLGLLLIGIAADRGLGAAPDTVREFMALEAGGLLLGDFLESLIGRGINPDGIVSLAIQLSPTPAVSVVTGATRLQFGEPSPSSASGVVISGDTLRAIIEDFSA